MVFGPFPCDPPVVVVRVMPEDFSNSGRSLPYAAENPPEMMTLTWAEDVVGKARTATAATAMMNARQLLHMAFDSRLKTRLAPILCEGRESRSVNRGSSNGHGANHVRMNGALVRECSGC